MSKSSSTVKIVRTTVVESFCLKTLLDTQRIADVWDVNVVMFAKYIVNVEIVTKLFLSFMIIILFSLVSVGLS